MSKSTPATIALTKAGVAFDLHTYDYDPGSERVGLQAAEALGEDRRLKYRAVLAYKPRLLARLGSSDG
jgi:prolyl-tRNA editing enzyme YbaK/EbsC (Cys-tRNA(Pro) deacylase)